VPLDAQQRIFPPHSTTIIDHPNERSTPTLNFDRNMTRPCIETVFHKLPNDSGGPLHHFPRSNLASEGVWENSDFRHVDEKSGFRLGVILATVKRL
jgi:hypothetical protein